MTPEFFLAQIIHRFPLLDVRTHNGKKVVGGMMEIGKGDDVVDRYKIAIHVFPDFPAIVPKVYELGNSIPKTTDRHFCPADESACLFVPEERYKYCNNETTPLNFVRGPVYSFFVSQAHFNLTGIWPLGVRPHGIEGIINYYQEEFGLKRPESVVAVIRFLASPEIKERGVCPCGRSRKIKICHKQTIQGLRATFPPDYFAKLADVVQSHFNGEKFALGGLTK